MEKWEQREYQSKSTIFHEQWIFPCYSGRYSGSTEIKNTALPSLEFPLYAIVAAGAPAITIFKAENTPD